MFYGQNFYVKSPHVSYLFLATETRVSLLEGLGSQGGHADRNWECRKQWAQHQAPGIPQAASLGVGVGTVFQEDATQKAMERGLPGTGNY